MDSGCILCLVSCACKLVGLAVLQGGCTPHNFKENLFSCIIMYVYVCICHVVVLRVIVFNLYAVKRHISMLS